MIALIAAVARNGVIGKDGKIPWHLPEDLKRFKALTMGRTLLMGRKTYESIGKPLSGRQTIVLTKTREIQEWIPGSFPPGSLAAKSMSSLDEIFHRVRTAPSPWDDLFICGGAEVYREALERDVVDEMYLTRVDADYEGDVFMPEIDYSRWEALIPMGPTEDFSGKAADPYWWSEMWIRKRAIAG